MAWGWQAGSVTLMALAETVAALQRGELVSDNEFDKAVFLPAYRGLVSRLHWTPMDVAVRAATLLAGGGCRRILDIGAGVGKFCIVGALTTSADFVGVEQRVRLVEAARTAAERAGASRASFVHANVVDIDFADFDGVYLYNPFYEQVAVEEIPIDDTIEPSYGRYLEYVAMTTRKLREMRPGTRVVIYSGFGGDMPSEYERVPVRHRFWTYFELWVRR